MKEIMQFEFMEQVVPASQDTYVARLPAKISTKKELLQALYEHLRLPGYFGFNWDALADCLRDFHWLGARTVVLVHAELPPLPPEDCRTYLIVLAEAVASWQSDGGDHNLRVVFPAEAYAEVAALLAK